MELLGKSLEDIFENILQKKPMSLRCVCNLGYQMIDILYNCVVEKIDADYDDICNDISKVMVIFKSITKLYYDDQIPN